MRALLDSCVLLWWVCESRRLSPTAKAIFEDPRSVLYWSAASSWELAIKSSQGGLRLPGPLHEFLPRALEEDRIVPLPVDHRHAMVVARLPHHHRDPFDRMLVAQASVEGLPVITSDRGL